MYSVFFVFLMSVSYIDKAIKVNVTNKVLYSLDCDKSDWPIYDSAIFSTLVEVYGTSQNINAFRLKDLMPEPLGSKNWPEVNAELMDRLSFGLEEANILFELNRDWIERSFSRREWPEAIVERVATEKEIRDLINEIESLEFSDIGLEA